MDGNPVNALRRYEKIMEVLLEHTEVTVQDLSEQLQVTGKTIREDLGKLEEKGLLLRVHGGAVLAHEDQLGMLSAKEPNVRHVSEKAEIAARAMTYIQQGDIIALDGGSTTLEIARALENRPYTVITNDLYIISELAPKDQIRLVVPGGYRVRNMLAGGEAIAYIRQLNIQKAFISATAAHAEFGLSVYTGELIDFKRALVETAQLVYAVIDHSKFGRSALRTFAALSELDGIISDSRLAPDVNDAFQKAGVLIDYK
jgi:DeoR family fructose operon transcriptional repressor